MKSSVTRRGRSLLAASMAAAFLTWIPQAAHAAPKARLWERWLAHREESTLRVNHAAWGEFLDKYVLESADGVNRVSYGSVAPEDKRKLEGYIASLAAVPVSRLGRSEQLAYWINLYNALTVKVVLDHYPMKSILDIRISPGWFSKGPWGKKLVTVEGEALSLDDIEHRILRPIWRDPRVHYAVNCASVGCPNLARLPYTAETVEGMLDRNAREYVNHPRGVSVAEKGLVVSSIYEWFKEDFGGTDRAVIQHLKKYASPSLAKALAKAARIDDDRYDWRLNDASLPGLSPRVQRASGNRG